ncbi:DNA-binding protein, partial [Acinetobacter baumannii]
MTSQEIADLVQARHDNVKRTIETLINSGVIASPQIEEMVTTANNRQYTSQVYLFEG